MESVSVTPETFAAPAASVAQEMLAAWDVISDAEPAEVVIRFAGDSGDGIQLTGSEFSRSIADGGHEFVTHPDYPAEIRAPAGTLPEQVAFR